MAIIDVDRRKLLESVFNMKIIVITGSSHQDGTSEQLANSFIKGATESGNNILRFDAGKLDHDKVLPQYVDASESSIQVQDDIQDLIPKLEDSDMLVFVTPLYYYGPTAQLKSVIDRFYAYNHFMKDKDTALLVTAFDPVEKFKAIDVWFNVLSDYMRWNVKEKIYAGRAWSELDKYLDQAYKLGKSIK